MQGAIRRIARVFLGSFSLCHTPRRSSRTVVLPSSFAGGIARFCGNTQCTTCCDCTPGIVSWAAAWQQAPRCPPSIATGVRQQAFLMSDRSRPAGAARGGRAALWLPPAEAS